MKNAVHDGHRERMRQRIEQNGAATLQSHELLEYILYSFVPRKDTNEIAHALIDKFGSFAGVLNADAQHLAEIKGMTRNAALFLSNMPSMFRRYSVDTESVKLSLKGRGKAREFMRRQLYGATVEQVVAAALDAQDNVIKYEILAAGTGDGVAVSVRSVVDFALKYKASGILLAHNHPSGSVKPSQQDLMITREIAWTLNSVGTVLQDHFIFNSTDYYSFDEQGKLRAMMEERDITLKDGILFYE